MGGRQYTQRGRQGRPRLRRAVLPAVFGALAGALVGVLVGVLFLCARPGESHPAPDVRAHAVCVSPYDLPGCSPLAHAVPGVPPVQPPAVVLAGGDVADGARAGGAGRIRPPEPFARGPDLHVLQVLRT